MSAQLSLALGLILMIGGLLGTTIGGIYFKSGYDQITKPAAPTLRAVLDVDCVQRPLPTTVQPNEDFWLINLNADGGTFSDSLMRYSFKSSSATWPDAVAINAFRCVVRNDSETALRHIEIDLALTFKAVITKGTALESGETVAQRTNTVLIDRIDRGGRFEFWGAAMSPHFAIVSFPETARAKTIDGETEVLARLINNAPRGVVAGPRPS